MKGRDVWCLWEARVCQLKPLSGRVVLAMLYKPCCTVRLSCFTTVCLWLQVLLGLCLNAMDPDGYLPPNDRLSDLLLYIPGWDVAARMAVPWGSPEKVCSWAALEPAAQSLRATTDWKWLCLEGEEVPWTEMLRIKRRWESLVFGVVCEAILLGPWKWFPFNERLLKSAMFTFKTKIVKHRKNKESFSGWRHHHY